MPDTRQLLERARASIEPPPDMMGDLRLLRDRRRRRERVVAGIAALIAVAGAAFLLRSFVGPEPIPIKPPTRTGLLTELDQGRVLFMRLRDGRHTLSTVEGDRLEALVDLPEVRMARPVRLTEDLLIVEGERGGTLHLSVLSLSTGDLTPFTHGPSGQEKPDVAPDGTAVVYGQFDPDTGRDLGMRITNADGTQTRRLLPPAPEGSTVGATDPAFSPDGDEIAFTRVDYATGRSAIFVVGTDGTGLRRLTPRRLNAANPAWSPDGSTIAFDRRFYSGDGHGGLWSVPVAGGPATALTDHADDEWAFEPQWSPDGTEILFKYFFFGEPRDNNELHLVDADGANERVLWVGRSEEGAESPEWEATWPRSSRRQR